MTLRESTTLSLREKLALYMRDKHVEHPAPWTAIEAAMETFDLLAPCLEALEAAQQIITLTDPKLSDVEMNTLTTRQYIAFKPYAEALANLESRLSAEGEK